MKKNEAIKKQLEEYIRVCPGYRETKLCKGALNLINALEAENMGYKAHYGERVNGDLTVTYDGFVRIIYGDKGKTICLNANGDETDKFISLNDCLKEIGYDGTGVVYVIFDDCTQGAIYQCGNYGAYDWIKYGETAGYA